AAAIASMDMGLLLRDDVFVDFFNTFLNLPVFGQTPIYISSTGQWNLWPELPSHLDPSPQALLAWLEKHRLPHFCKSSLCLHLILCQKLLGFIRSGEAAKLLNWQSGDQWLLEKCISGSQGMWHFQAFLQGMAGEELTNFWLTTEMLLGLDESDEKQRDLYLSLLHRLQATHLREGSTVSTLCRTITGSLPKARHVQPISTRREILSKMQEQVLFMIQSYWLPKFFIHCKVCLEEEKSCQPLLQEYQESLLGGNSQKPSGFSEQLFTMHIKRSQGLSGPYCSKKAKAEVWTLIKGRKDTQEMKIPSFQVQPGPPGSTKESHLNKAALGLIPQGSEHPANTAFKGKREATSPKRSKLLAKKVINPEDFCEDKILHNLHSSAPLVQLPSLKKPGKTLSLLPWALSAETCAGQPFRHFLKHQGWSVETHLLDLWHDLEEFLPLVLDPSRENSFFLRHLIGEKICKTYLDDGSSEQLPLEPRTLRSLREHLMSGEFSPWISRAQKEICKVLCCFYEEFLADDDRTFLQYMAKETHREHEHLHGSEVPMPKMQGHALKRDEGFLLSQRLNESLQLSQALHGTRNLEGLSSEHWQLIATQDLQKGGFIQAEVEILLHKKDSQKKMTKVFAVDQPSNEDELPSQKSSSLAVEPENTQKRTLPGRKKSCIRTVEVEKPTRRPRNFVKLLHNPGHLQYFKKFLEEHNAEKPLCFWMAVEKLATETNPKTKSCLVNCIVTNYFHAEIPAEEQLDSHSSIIREISEAEEVSSSMLMTAQVFVQKAMEKRWFKEYQNLFPPSDTHKPNLRLQHRVRNVKTDKLRWAWYAIRDIVKSLCKFRKEMNNDKSRRDFEDFLHLELEKEDEKQLFPSFRHAHQLNAEHQHHELSPLPHGPCQHCPGEGVGTSQTSDV
ncbi:RGSL protein, partial [Galbula dea]|nr:RGSL protein [Galbula dea]